MLLADKVIVISGVGPGLGRTLALEAAREGARVVLGARSNDFLATVAAEVEADGGAALALSTDVTDVQQCQSLVAAAMQRFGRIAWTQRMARKGTSQIIRNGFRISRGTKS